MHIRKLFQSDTAKLAVLYYFVSYVNLTREGLLKFLCPRLAYHDSKHIPGQFMFLFVVSIKFMF